MTDPENLASLDWSALQAAVRGLLADSADDSADALTDAVSHGDWRSVVELLTLRITEAAPALDDAGLRDALDLYESVLDRSELAGAYSRHEAVARRLNLSSALLRKVTSREDAGLLDPAAIADLVLRELPLPLDDAESKARHWRELDRTEILRLRKAKNLLTPALAALRHATPNAPIDARLEPWEALLPHLP
jgi:hypothetical protein